jgi:hypothetical protein
MKLLFSWPIGEWHVLGESLFPFPQAVSERFL